MPDLSTDTPQSGLPLATKLHAPPPRPNQVFRPRLTGRLDDALRLGHRLTLISAPAGFGKTTLVTEWLQSVGRPFTWLSLDEGDSDPLRFLSYLVAALQQIEGAVGQTVQYLQGARHPPSIESLVTALLGDVAALPTAFVLVLDDYHAIRTDSVHKAVRFLIEYRPPQMHLVVVTRRDPPLPLARLRVLGQMTEIRAHDLRFTAEETAAFIHQTMGLDLGPETTATLERRTEGWVAGLQLAALSLRGCGNAEELVTAFNGRHRYVMDYLAEEVFQQQPDEIREFLCQTAILDWLTAPLCDAVTGRDDSRAILAQLEQSNLFLISLDDRREWYRYHHLFADFLRTQLPAGEQASLHRKAAAWFEAGGCLAEAVKHALASGDLDTAARLITLAAAHVTKDHELRAALGWLEALPDEFVRASYELATHKAWASFLTGPIEAAESYMTSAEGNLPPDASPVCRGRLIGLRALLALVREDHANATQLCQEALDLIGEANPLFRSAVLAILAQAHEESSGDTAAAVRMLREALLIQQRLGNHIIALHALHDLACFLNKQGQRHEAATLCRRAIGQHVNAQGTPLPLTGPIYVCLGIICYEADELVQAREYLLQGLEFCQQLAIDRRVDVLEGMAVLARIQQAMGQGKAALRTVRDARQLCTGWRYDRAAAMLAAVEADLQLKQGNLAAALRWGETARLSLADPPIPGRERAYFTYARLLLAQDRPREAESVLATLEHSARAGERRRSLITIRILQALARKALGHEEAAVAWLEEALRLAAPEGYRRAFLNEGQAIVGLLRKARHAAPGFVDELVHSASAEARRRSASPPPQLAADPLSERELEVLRLVAAGLSNREIAQELVITLGTAKWHVHNIYEKLGVHSRAQAIALARELDLL